jgi:hypothetical protein
MRKVVLPFFVLVAACGNSAAPTTPTTASSATPSEPATSVASAEPPASASPSEPEPQRKKRPLEIKNACHSVVTVVFGEDPKAETSGKRTIAGDTSIDGPRDAEGKMTVHLLDEKSEKVATVHVTRGMKKVEIGASCRTLDAR